MSKKEFSCEELSEIYDKVCSENSVIKKVCPEMCEDSYNEYVQLEKTVKILNSLKEIRIEDESFSVQVLKKCCYAQRRMFSVLQRYVLPSLAAASFFMVISFGIYNGNIRIGKKTAPVIQNRQFEIVLQEQIPVSRLKSVIADNNGLVVKNEEGSVSVRSSMSDYLKIKSFLTLTEEERAFSDQENDLLMTGTNSRSLSSTYIDEIVTFKIILK